MPIDAAPKLETGYILLRQDVVYQPGRPALLGPSGTRRTSPAYVLSAPPGVSSTVTYCQGVPRSDAAWGFAAPGGTKGSSPSQSPMVS